MRSAALQEERMEQPKRKEMKAWWGKDGRGPSDEYWVNLTGVRGKTGTQSSGKLANSNLKTHFSFSLQQTLLCQMFSAEQQLVEFQERSNPDADSRAANV